MARILPAGELGVCARMDASYPAHLRTSYFNGAIFHREAVKVAKRRLPLRVLRGFAVTSCRSTNTRPLAASNPADCEKAFGTLWPKESSNRMPSVERKTSMYQ